MPDFFTDVPNSSSGAFLNRGCPLPPTGIHQELSRVTCWGDETCPRDR